jgi:hypothetical protein
VGKIVFQTEPVSDVISGESVVFERLKKSNKDAGEALQLVRLMIVIALADGPPNNKQITLIEKTAKALNVQEPGVYLGRLLSENRLKRFRIEFIRRSHIRNYFANTYRMGGGVGAVVKGVLAFRGVLANPTLSAQFLTLGQLPSETLGRHFHDHCVESQIPFPGAKGGFPIGAVYHDFTHVLSGYDTSPEGEMKAAAFQAGYTHGQWDFFTLLFALLIHTAGINVAPFEMPKLLGRIGQRNLAVEVFHALQRGTQIKKDLGDQWDFWADVEQPIENVRRELGIKPVDVSLLAA